MNILALGLSVIGFSLLATVSWKMAVGVAFIAAAHITHDYVSK